MNLAKERELITIDPRANQFASRNVEAGVRNSEIGEDKKSGDAKHAGRHANTLADLALPFPLAQLVIGNADDSRDQLQKRVSLSVFAFTRVRRNRFGGFAQCRGKTFEKTRVGSRIWFAVDDQTKDAMFAPHA